MTPDPRKRFPDFLPPPQPADEGRELVVVGRVGRPHGLAGHFAARSLGSERDGSVLEEVDAVWLRPPGEELLWCATRVTGRKGGGLLLQLQGVSRREQVQALVHWDIAVDRADFPEAGEDEVYVVDLIGLQAVDPDGTVVGTVQDVWEGPAHDNLVLLGPGGEEIMVPFVEAHVADVDVEGGRVLLTGRPLREST